MKRIFKNDCAYEERDIWGDCPILGIYPFVWAIIASVVLPILIISLVALIEGLI